MIPRPPNRAMQPTQHFAKVRDAALPNCQSAGSLILCLVRPQITPTTKYESEALQHHHRPNHYFNPSLHRMLSLARSRRQAGNRRRTHHTQTRVRRCSCASGHVEGRNSSHRPNFASEFRDGDRPYGGEWRILLQERPWYHGSLRYPAGAHVGGRSLRVRRLWPDRGRPGPSTHATATRTRPNDPWLVVFPSKGAVRPASRTCDAWSHDRNCCPRQMNFRLA